MTAKPCRWSGGDGVAASDCVRTDGRFLLHFIDQDRAFRCMHAGAIRVEHKKARSSITQGGRGEPHTLVKLSIT
jgi:hypothetical protein